LAFHVLEFATAAGVWWRSGWQKETKAKPARK
jgi:hypothetical protein